MYNSILGTHVVYGLYLFACEFLGLFDSILLLENELMRYISQVIDRLCPDIEKVGMDLEWTGKTDA